LTPDDVALNLDFFRTGRPITLYRIARARYANLSGVGAALARGRWNHLGQEAIYTSTERSLPVLEKLVNLRKDLIPSNQALMTISVSGNWEGRENGPLDTGIVDRDTGAAFWFYRTLADAKNAFVYSNFSIVGKGLTPFAVAVPSVIVPVWNVVLYPQGNGFWDHVKLENIEPFEFDSRLFPEGTPPEPETKPVLPSA
jgi:RES domain-containing protein